MSSSRSRNGGLGRLASAAVRCQPDSRLVGLVQAGHEVAFEEIVRRYRARLVSYAAGIVPDLHAEDVVQEALTKAHSALGSADAEVNLKPWLYTIVRNRALNALRDEPVHAHLDENFDGVPQPPEVAARREELAELTARVGSLPDPQREAIVKRELEGRSHAEIASSLGVAPGAVRGLIYRARATLRDGAGMLIPMPVLRALLGSGSPSPEATGAAAAAVAAGGGGGIALKAGATLGVAVIAVGSGFAVQQRSAKSDDQAEAAQRGDSRAGHAHGGAALLAGGVDARRDIESENEGPGSGSDDSSGSGDGDEGSSGSSSNSGSESSGEGSGTGDGGSEGSSGSGGGGGGADTSGSGGGERSGSSGSGSGSSGSGTSGSGSGTSGSGSGTSGSGEQLTSDSDGGGGTSGSGSSDGGTTTTTTTTTSESGDGSSGGGSSGSG